MYDQRRVATFAFISELSSNIKGKNHVVQLSTDITTITTAYTQEHHCTR